MNESGILQLLPALGRVAGEGQGNGKGALSALPPVPPPPSSLRACSLTKSDVKGAGTKTICWGKEEVKIPLSHL